MSKGVQNDDGTFLRPTSDEIIEQAIDRAETNFGPDVDLSQGSPIKQIVDTTTAEHEHIWKLMEEVYYSAYYQDAHGAQLDKLLAIASVDRLHRRGATGIVNFSTQVANERDIVVPEGTRVSTERTDERPPIPFKTTEPARLEAGDAVINAVPIRACEPWETNLDSTWLGEETNVAAGTIQRFETPVKGIDRVRNPYPTGAASREYGYSFIQGRDRETDAEYRRRFESQFGSEAFATLDSIKAELRATNGVLNVGMEENTTMVDNTSEGGLPRKSFRATILGDAHPNDIAQAIHDKRPVGIQSYGNSTGTAYDDDHTERPEQWDWATEVPVYTDITVTHNDDYPSDGNLRVEDEVIDYIGGTLSDGTVVEGTGMGEDVIHDIVHSKAMGVNGVWSVDVAMGTDEETMLSDDIAVPENHAALTAYDDVNIFSNYQQIG